MYAEIRQPYMGVDGRVAMARDDHRTHGGTLVMQTVFETEPVSGQLLCRATVTSSLYVGVTAHARVFVEGSGVNQTNPLENAETSAIGRALGFLGGYGLFGTGLASAEEVLAAREWHEIRGESGPAPEPEVPAAAGTPGASDPVPSAKQL